MTDRIIVDSCCDGLPAFKKEMQIQSVPLTLTLGEEHFVDDETLDLPAYMEKMKKFQGRITSACPSPAAYEEAFIGEDTAYGVTLSANLSGSYASAMIGKELAEAKGASVHVFNTKSASAGEVLVALKLRQLIDIGQHKEEIIATVEQFISKMKTYFVLDNLDNLVKNGRMNKIAGTLVSAMHIKPIMGADTEGNIIFCSYARGVKNLVSKLADLVERSGKATVGENLVISHCNNISLAEQLKQAILQRYHFKNIFVVPTGGISSMYANNGGIIMAF